MRWVEMMAIGLALGMSALPFVVLAPEPPAFGRGAVLIVASFFFLASVVGRREVGGIDVAERRTWFLLGIRRSSGSTWAVDAPPNRTLARSSAPHGSVGRALKGGLQRRLV